MALVVVGCSSPTIPESAPVEELAGGVAEAEEAWTQWEGSDYLVSVTQTGQAHDGCQWVSEVHDGVVESRWSSKFDIDCGSRPVSVPELHSDIRLRMSELDVSGGKIEIEWAENGAPVVIEIEQDETGGERLSLAVVFEDLSRLPGQSSVRMDLAEERATWAGAAISRYRVEVTESRNYWTNGCVWITVVAEGQIVSATVDPESTSQNCAEIEWTVAYMHDQIAHWADAIDRYSDQKFGEHTLEVEYNESGVPVHVVFDMANGSDEESSLSVRFLADP